jgi:hypothetical protein
MLIPKEEWDAMKKEIADIEDSISTLQARKKKIEYDLVASSTKYNSGDVVVIESKYAKTLIGTLCIHRPYGGYVLGIVPFKKDGTPSKITKSVFSGDDKIHYATINDFEKLGVNRLVNHE